MASKYFRNFPFRGYTLDENAGPGDYVVVTDIFRRVKFVGSTFNDPRVYYPYQIQDGDTPENIAHRYYGSVDYFWIVTLKNNIIDPLRDFPKTYATFIKYLEANYGSVAAAQSQIHHYTKTVTKTNSDGESSSLTTIIDETEYLSLTSLVPEVYTFNNGSTVTVTITRGSVDCYTYEDEANEQKRNIVLLKSDYLPQVKHELETLLSA